MKSLARIFLVAVAEWKGALRSRRVLVMLLLYLVAAVACMYGTISIFSRTEAELVQVLQLPESESTGVVSKTLWKSQPFQRMARRLAHSSLVYEDIKGRHPIELVYAWFVFFCAPLLVVLVSGNRVSDDLRSGAVRYAIVRCTRTEWSFGKYLGLALMLACGLAASAAGAWIVALCRLTEVGPLLPAMFDWGARAWLYSIAWLGVALGISHMTRAGSRAVAFGIFSVFLLCALPDLLKYIGGQIGHPWLENFDLVSPAASKLLLWRRNFAPLFEAAFKLVTLGMLYLALGNAVLRRRDA